MWERSTTPSYFTGPAIARRRDKDNGWAVLCKVDTETFREVTLRRKPVPSPDWSSIYVVFGHKEPTKFEEIIVRGGERTVINFNFAMTFLEQAFWFLLSF